MKRMSARAGVGTREARGRGTRAGGTCALAVMVKAPRTGEVKTRLVPPLTHGEAAALGSCLLSDTANNISEVAAVAAAEALAVYTPAGAERVFDALLPEGFGLLRQRGGDLGERLYNAAEDLFGLGYGSVCLINADAPTLPRASLEGAVASLARPGERVVVGPADDGGYYLIGLKRAHARLFERVEWSTARVRSQTVERAAEIGLEVELLPPWYDVDDAGTLARLCDELFGENGAGSRHGGYAAPATRAFLAAILESEGRVRVWPNGSPASQRGRE